MRTFRWVIVAVAVAVAVGSFGVVAPAGAQSAAAPGVTAKEIKVGGVVGKTNPTGRPYENGFIGAQAYFDLINKKGGVNGRKISMVAKYDDQSRDSKNIAAIRSLVEEDKVFAVLPVETQNFAGADYLVSKGTPTFGWNINTQWAKGPNLFGAGGSYICMTCPIIAPTFIAQQQGAKKVGLLAYGSSPSSTQCSEGQEAGFDKWGPKVSFKDRSLSFGFSANDVSAAVQAVKDNNVDFIATCMDVNGESNFNKALKQAGVTGVKYYAPEGYDTGVLKELGSDLDGFTFVIGFLPFENAKESKEMQLYIKEMKKRGIEPGEHSLVGWNSAQLLVEGLKKVGKNVTQKGLVDAINSITDWTYAGMRPTVDWTTAHGPAPVGGKSCSAYVEVKNGKFVPVYNQPGKPFVCFPENPYPATLVPEYSAS